MQFKSKLSFLNCKNFGCDNVCHLLRLLQFRISIPGKPAVWRHKVYIQHCSNRVRTIRMNCIWIGNSDYSHCLAEYLLSIQSTFTRCTKCWPNKPFHTHTHTHTHVVLYSNIPDDKWFRFFAIAKCASFWHFRLRATFCNCTVFLRAISGLVGLHLNSEATPFRTVWSWVWGTLFWTLDPRHFPCAVMTSFLIYALC